MDTLSNKAYLTTAYTCRYSTVPYYFDTLNSRYVMGIGSGVKKDTEFVLHTVSQNDNLDLLALKYYNNPTLWWAIGLFNNIQDAFAPLTPGTVIKIPALASLAFGADR